MWFKPRTFALSDGGFTITQGRERRDLLWNRVSEITAFMQDKGVYTAGHLVFRDDEGYVYVSEEDEDELKAVAVQLPHHFPGFPADWRAILDTVPIEGSRVLWSRAPSVLPTAVPVVGD